MLTYKKFQKINRIRFFIFKKKDNNFKIKNNINQDSVICFKATKTLKKALQVAADKQNIGASEYLRRLIFQEIYSK